MVCNNGTCGMCTSRRRLPADEPLQDRRDLVRDGRGRLRGDRKRRERDDVRDEPCLQHRNLRRVHGRHLVHDQPDRLQERHDVLHDRLDDLHQRHQQGGRHQLRHEHGLQRLGRLRRVHGREHVHDEPERSLQERHDVLHDGRDDVRRREQQGGRHRLRHEHGLQRLGRVRHLHGRQHLHDEPGRGLQERHDVLHDGRDDVHRRRQQGGRHQLRHEHGLQRLGRLRRLHRRHGCTTNPTACKNGTTSCTTGAMTCIDGSNKARRHQLRHEHGLQRLRGLRRVHGRQRLLGQPDPCKDGTTSCSTGATTCIDTATNRSAGSSCGTNMVCNGSGVCVACTAGTSCNTNPGVCKVGVTSCTTGAMTCVDSANDKPAGTQLRSAPSRAWATR